MTTEETKSAFFKGVPVKYNGIRYNCISALIYRRKQSKMVLEAELFDRCGHAIIIADPNKVEVYKDESNA